MVGRTVLNERGMHCNLLIPSYEIFRTSYRLFKGTVAIGVKEVYSHGQCSVKASDHLYDVPLDLKVAGPLTTG